MEFNSVFERNHSTIYISRRYFKYSNVIYQPILIILFSLFRNSNSFQYIDELGYYYFFNNNDSITNTRYEPLKAEEVIYSIFTNLEFLYEKTGNTFLDKYYCLFKLKTGYKKYKPCFQYLHQFNLVENIFNKLLKSNYISKENKLIINNIKKEIKYTILYK